MPDKYPQENRPVALIVDDDPAQRLLLQEALIQAGLTVNEAGDGAEALTLFERLSPDLVIMDIKMPVMDGLEACSRIRQLPEGKYVPIVLITGLDDHESIKQAFDADATDFITKPVNWPILNHRVHYLLKASEAFSALHQSETRLFDAQRIAALGNWEWDIVNNKLHWSNQIYQIFGLQPQEFEATYEAFLNSVHPDDKEYVAESVNRALNDHEPYSIDHRIVLPDGSERTVHEQAEVILSKDGEPIRMQGAVQDITQRKMAEEQILHLAYYDTLTGLPNRMHFKEHANRTLDLARNDGTKVALMFLDLDEFKRVNDTLGHDIGDDLLKTIAQNLTEGLRTSDSVAKVEPLTSSATTLSRLGGDEFTILLGGFANGEQVAHVAQRVLDHLCRPVVVRDQEFFITGSIGIAVYPDDGEDVDTLQKHADIAMYQAKNHGKNGFQFYSERLNTRTPERLGLESKLRKALERDELVLHYQPQVSAATGDIIGMEALVRWEDPETGLVPPDRFIPAAEESGLILPIGEWVLQTACNQALAWQQAGFKPMKMSVNLSSHQFRQHGFIQAVQRALDSSRLSPQHLELEMTESVIMQQVNKTIADLKKLKDFGLCLAIDDFGTGYSSMNYLKRFPLDTLKIDRSFVKDISTDTSDAAIVKAIIALAKSLDLITIAEGVEMEAQLSFLREMGCDHIQGYFFSRPLPVNELEQFLTTNGAVVAYSDKEIGL
jgi:diguanylate cyclase (GGDEF)-like protein/PAS domain S-box-containing protein